MSDIKQSYYKYCIVPLCTNTTVCSKKIFFSVPKDPFIRKSWTRAMRRSDKLNPKLSNKSTLWVCEDHFSLKDDMENYMEWLLTKNVKRFHLVPGTVPHRFECQNRNIHSPIERKIAKKGKHMALIKEALALPVAPTSCHIECYDSKEDESANINPPGRSTENNSIGYIDLDNTTVIKREPLDSPETGVIPHTYDWDDPINCSSPLPSVPPIASIPPILCRSVQTTSQAELCQEDILTPTSEAPFKKPKMEDRFDVFGKNVAYKLCEMDKVQRILAEKIINDALFEGEMGVLTRHHKLIVESQTLSHPEVPCQTSVHYIFPNSRRSVSPSTVSMHPLANVSITDE